MWKAWLVVVVGFCPALLAGEQGKDDLAQMPTQTIKEGESSTLDIYSLARAAAYTFSDEDGRTKVVCEVFPDGYIRFVRVFGIADCRIPVRSKQVEFSLSTGQRVGVWSVSNLEVRMVQGRLVFGMTPPSWAIAIEVEFGGLTGLMVKFNGQEGVLYTDQRMDTVLAPDGAVILARSGEGTEPEMPEPQPEVAPRAGSDNLEQPGARKPPKGWHKKARWTDLPFLPGVVEPVLPLPVSP